MLFQKCNELISLDLSNFNTSKVTEMQFMFNKCYKLKEIKGINNFNTFNLANMIAIFCMIISLWGYNHLVVCVGVDV